MGGASAMMSMDILAPINTNAWKRHKSPNTNPINPEIISNNQVRGVASTGSNNPREETNVKMERKTNPTINLKRFTTIDPTLLLEASKANAVMVQNRAVNNAAISPACFTIH